MTPEIIRCAIPLVPKLCLGTRVGEAPLRVPSWIGAPLVAEPLGGQAPPALFRVPSPTGREAELQRHVVCPSRAWEQGKTRGRGETLWRSVPTPTELPEALRRFHDEQCLHDADWCGVARLPTYAFPLNSQDVTVIARQENTLIPEFKNTLAILQYVVAAPPVIEKPLESKVFSDVQPIWLYDEIDRVGPGVFSHSILVSNGLVVTIQFREFRYHIAPLLALSRNGAVEQQQPAARPQSASA